MPGSPEKQKPLPMRTLTRLIFALSLMLLAASMWLGERLPERGQMLAALAAEPVQTPLTMPAFQARAGDTDYTVQPLHRYEIHGLVVSRHDTAAWWDIVHRDWGDRLNVVDLCVIWGPNLANDAYRGLRYWSEVFTCNVGTDSQALWEQFEPDALSNNHLLAADAAVARALRGVRVGDQVRVRGYLAEYGHDQGRVFRRGTSTVRTDRGNGACETIWVTEARVLKPGNPGWRMARWLALAGLAVAVLLWWRLPMRLD